MSASNNTTDILYSDPVPNVIFDENFEARDETSVGTDGGGGGGGKYPATTYQECHRTTARIWASWRKADASFCRKVYG